MFIPPMLLETAPAPFDHADYIFEPKIDGHRLILSRQAGVTRLYTRHHNDCTRQYPELYDLFPDDIILDGEVACTDHASGTIDFEAVMERFGAKRSNKILRLTAARPAHFVVFDILRYRGEDVRGWPLMKRKELLGKMEFGNPRISAIPFVERDGERLYRNIVARKLEGLVGKRKESVYVSHRSAAWKKIINWSYAEVAITGWKKNEFGWLCAVQSDEGLLRHAGVIELGVTPAHRQAFSGAIRPYITGEDLEQVYVEPVIKARVKMRNWTKKGLLRSPVFIEFILP